MKALPLWSPGQKVEVSRRVRVTWEAASVAMTAQLAESSTSVTPPIRGLELEGDKHPLATLYRWK